MYSACLDVSQITVSFCIYDVSNLDKHLRSGFDTFTNNSNFLAYFGILFKCQVLISMHTHLL